MAFYLGIETGGTKLQLGVGTGEDTELFELVRCDIVPERGAQGILEQIEKAARPLFDRFDISAIGFSFGGPVDTKRGAVTKSHQIDGWDGFPLADWCREKFAVPSYIENDANAAALAEANFGVGQDFSTMFYITVGSGIGGGLIDAGRIVGDASPAASEIGHLRPGLEATSSDMTLESIASGWGIAERVRRQLRDDDQSDAAADLLKRCSGNVEQLTTKQIGEAATEGNAIAVETLRVALQTLGWAIAQTITLTGAQCVAIGGGVSLLGEELFFKPLRQQVEKYVFPPMRNQYRIEPTALDELPMVYGALAVAKTRDEDADSE